MKIDEEIKSTRNCFWSLAFFVIFSPFVHKAAAQDDVADIHSQKLLAANDSNKCYFLTGADENRPAPKNGFSLLVVMPGGDGMQNSILS